MTQDLQGELRTFVGDVVRDMGLDANVEVETLEDGSIRVDIQGDGGEVLLRRKGEGLDALQHIVNTAFRRDLDSQRIVIDSLGFRRGKDLELEQMTRFLIDRARSTGTPQELGPLNSYARRVVHMEVAKHAGRDLGEPGRRRREARHHRDPRAEEIDSRPGAVQSRMFSTDDTIVAIATPPGRAGLGVIRVSGPDAQSVAARLLTRREPLTARHATSRAD